MSCYDSYQIGALVLVFLIGGSIVGGFIGYNLATHPVPNVIHIITVGCYRLNATSFKHDITKPLMNVTQITVNSGALVSWPPFQATEGTYPNGTLWARLVVNC